MASRRISKPSYAVSACLAGIECTYKGKDKLVPRIQKLVRTGRAIPVCPEVMGGLTIPRENSEIANARMVVTASGKDITEKYTAGSRMVLEIVRQHRIKAVILKSKSPACGYGQVYDGTFCRHLKVGNGVLTSILLKHRIKILKIPRVK